MATYGYLCPTPKQHCCGSASNLSAGLDKRGLKKHGTQQEAFNCYTRYLTDIEGYTRLTSREYQKPGEPILMLSKVSQFGARLRSGKHGEAGQGKSRGMPPSGKGGIVITS